MTRRTCPVCERGTRLQTCCGIDLTVRRKPWRMTPQLVREVHVLARARKGLTDEDYRLRLGAVGAQSCKELSRDQFGAFVAGLERLPDCPKWRARRQASGVSHPTTRSARG